MNEIIHTELIANTSLCGGKYIIEKKIGAGGFGITYLARHATLERKYAIKEFFLSGYNIRNNETNHISLQGIEEKDFNKFRQRFINEARTLATLNNDAVVKVIDIFDENGTSYMVMPFVEGITLQNLVVENGPMEYEMAINYIVRICDALSYIHSKNILHRDVTPDNIIVTPEQKTVLIDFGSARKFVDNKTQRHTTILKQGYAPLEQYSATSRKGAYTDLYSLGGVLYFILTGVRPIDATERTMEKMKEPIELNPKIPDQINAIIMKAMEMDSSNRYQSALELEEDILSGNNPKKDTPPSPITTNNIFPQQKVAKTNLLKILAFAIGVLTLVILLFTFRANFKNPTIENLDNIIVNKEKVESVSISIDSLLNEKRDAIMQRLSADPKDPAALYAIAKKASKYGCTNNRNMVLFWDSILIQEGDVNKYLCGNEISGTRFAYVCAARAYDNLDSSKYTLKIKHELKDSLITYMDQLINEVGVDGKKIY